jgi:hypothetical protein
MSRARTSRHLLGAVGRMLLENLNDRRQHFHPGPAGAYPCHDPNCRSRRGPAPEPRREGG